MVINGFDFLKSKLASLTTEKITEKISSWAEKYRSIPQGMSAKAGPYRNDILPHMVEIMDCFTPDSPVRSVAIMKSVQSGATTSTVENIIGYTIANNPMPIMLINKDETLVQDFFSKRIDKVIETCNLRKYIFSQSRKKNNRKTGETSSSIEFPSGYIRGYSAKSVGKIRMLSFQLIVGDEVDTYPKETLEGDLISVARGRANAFRETYKELWISTPVEESTSIIYKLFLEGDQRYYHVPCPRCEHYQVLTFDNLKFDRDESGRLIEDSVKYECENCKMFFYEYEKSDFMQAGKWIPTAEPINRGFRSYHVSGLMSNAGMLSWNSIIKDFLQSKSDSQKMRAFTNLQLGKPFKEVIQSPKFDKVMELRGNYISGEVPLNVAFLTLGADIQKDRIEYEVKGWGLDKTNYSIEYGVLKGATDNPNSGAFKQLEDVLSKTYTKMDNSASLNIAMALIDSGYNTDAVFDFCSDFNDAVLPVKGFGKEGLSRILREVKIKSRSGSILVEIVVDEYKNRVFSYLSKQLHAHQSEEDEHSLPYGYSTFPADYSESYYRMLASENKVAIKKAGRIVGHMWKKKYDGVRNEALDCCVYNHACADLVIQRLSLNYLGLDSPHWNDVIEYIRQEQE